MGCISCNKNYFIYNNDCVTQCNLDIYNNDSSKCKIEQPSYDPTIPTSIETPCNNVITITNKINEFTLDGSHFQLDTQISNCTKKGSYQIKWFSQLPSYILLYNNMSFKSLNNTLFPSQLPLETNVSLYVNNSAVSVDKVYVSFLSVSQILK